MKERGIIMGAESVRGILDGSKQNTMRIVKLPKGCTRIAGVGWTAATPECKMSIQGDWLDKNGEKHFGEWFIKCPFEVGQRLWVRETWGDPDSDHPLCGDGRKPTQGDKIVYRSEGADDWQWSRCTAWAGWRSPLFMPRWASRIDLEVLTVKAMRVQDITEELIIAEGCPREYLLGRNWFIPHWDSINGKTAPWKDNRWVWSVGFKRINPA